MHHCLSILEIFENICEHANGATKAQTTLAALSRTCRSFHDPALNCLWAVQTDGMVNLMHCMPPDLLEFLDNGEIRLLRPILAADWDRPLVHMRRIREMHCYLPMPGVSEFCAAFPDDTGTLFPKLTSLHWGNSWRREDSPSPSMEMMLSPRLTSLSLSALFSNTSISVIPRTCPTLKNLDVYYAEFADDRGGPVLSSCIRDLHSLECVEITVPDLPSLEHLGQLPGLTSLTAKLPDDLPLRLVAPLRFIALRSLVLRYKIEPVTDFFQRCSGVPLEDIAVDLDPCPTTAAIDKLWTALREGCSHSSLLSLAIDIEDYDPPETGDAYMINVQSFRILFCFVNLTSVSIASSVGFDVDDQDMKELVLAWPQIEVLRLQLTPWHTQLRQEPELSLRCLGVLAEQCQSLTDLEITLDATFIPEPDPKVRTRPVSQSALRNLGVGKSPIVPPTLHVTRFISAIFPSVSELTTYRSRPYCQNDDPEELENFAESIGYHRLWMEVDEQLPILTAIRNEEQLWAQAQLGAQ
ncbi:hypothetical protein C8R45DRAFT_867506 [Mycena sanguinolenta]|nr:hypothetical protein C8R45DRAFT_867506 [Mycena sanguinolenta]